MKRYRKDCKKTLCWLLITAMVLTGSSFSGLEVKAAELTENVAEVTDETKSETTEETVNEAVLTEDVVTESEESQAESETEGKTDIESSSTDVTPWTVTGDLAITTSGYNSNTSNYLYLWANAETEISLVQTVTNAEPGKYVVSLEAGGTYTQDCIMLNVKAGETTLTSVSLGAGSTWGTWADVTTEVFEVTEENADITIEIEGTMSVSTDIHLDNIACRNKSSYS